MQKANTQGMTGEYWDFLTAFLMVARPNIIEGPLATGPKPMSMFSSFSHPQPCHYSVCLACHAASKDMCGDTAGTLAAAVHILNNRPQII